MNYTIYCYFNSNQVQAILNSVVMLVGSGGVDGDYNSLIRIAGMIGMMIAVAGGMVKARGEDAGMYLVMMAVFYATLFTPRVTVTIQDGASGSPVQVDQVPLGLAFFASTTSKIGYWFTDKTETFFALPDSNLRFSTHGLMGGSRALREANSASVMDPVLQQDLVNFMRDCINPELASAPTQMLALMKSRELWGDFNTLNLVNPGRMVSLASGLAGAVTCDVAYTNLTASVTTETTSVLGEIARKISPDASPAQATTIINAMLPAAEGLMMTASADASTAIRQRMMINLLNDTSKTLAQVLNDPAAAQNAAAAAMSAQSANATYAVMAKLAAETLPMIRNSIELVVIGIFPIVLILIIIAGSKGGVVLRSYVMTMIWVNLWAPLYAIVNYVGTLSAAKQMTSVLAGVDGVAVVNAAALTNTTVSAEAVAGILTVLVPMIAMAIVKGGEVAMSGMVSGMTSPLTQAASKVGGAAGLGNYNVGNIGWGSISENNVGMNQSRAAFSSQDTGARTLENASGSASFAGGEIKSAQIKGFGGLGTSASTQKSLGNADTSGRTVSGGFTQVAALGEGLAAKMTNEKSASQVRSLMTTLGNVFGHGWDSSDTTGAGNAVKGQSGAGTRSDNVNTQGIRGDTTVSGGAELGGNSRTPGAAPSSNVLPGVPASATSPVVGAPASTTGATSSTVGAPGSATSPAVGAPGGAPASGSPNSAQPKTSFGSAAKIGGRASLGFSQENKASDGSHTGKDGSYASDTGQKFAMAFKALEKWEGGVNDSQTKAAGQAIRAALEQAQQASLTTGQSVSDVQNAGNSQTSQQVNSLTSQAIMGSKPAFEAALAHNGGNLSKTLDALNAGDTGTVNAALAGAQAATSTPEAQGVLATGGNKAPEGAAALKTNLQSKVAAANTGNRIAAAAQNKTDNAAVGKKQHASPTQAPDTSKVAATTGQVVGNHAAGLAQAQRQAKLSAGINSAASAINDRINEPGMQTWLKNFNDLNIPGVGQISSSKTTTADVGRMLGAIASTSPAVQDILINAADNGGKISPGGMDYISSQVTKMNDQRLNNK